MLAKSAIQSLLEIFELPKLLPKIAIRSAEFLNLICEITSRLPNFFDQTGNSKIADLKLKGRLVESVLKMLDKDSTVQMQNIGVKIGNGLSDFGRKKDSNNEAKLDAIFVRLMRLLVESKSAELRKKIIRGIKAPYS